MFLLDSFQVCLNACDKFSEKIMQWSRFRAVPNQKKKNEKVRIFSARRSHNTLIGLLFYAYVRIVKGMKAPTLKPKPEDLPDKSKTQLTWVKCQRRHWHFCVVGNYPETILKCGQFQNWTHFRSAAIAEPQYEWRIGNSTAHPIVYLYIFYLCSLHNVKRNDVRQLFLICFWN